MTTPRCRFGRPRGIALPDPARAQGGFALLSVIFFVLALTILGLSLFSLSNYEARFFNPALDRASAVQAARGALDWGRYVIENTDSLDLVWQAPKPPGVTRIVAWRDGGPGSEPDSVGRAFESPFRPIWIQATSDERGQGHSVLARYEVDAGTELYRRLITAVDFVRIHRTDGSPQYRDRLSQLRLYGPVATPSVRDETGGAVAVAGSWCQVPTPTIRPSLDLNGTWWTTRFTDPAAQWVSVPNAPSMVVTLDARGADHRYFKTDGHEVDAGGRYWSVLRDFYGPGQALRINVAGRAIWMLPEGIRIEQDVSIVNIDPGSEATLILLTRPGAPCTGTACLGTAFQGGLDVLGVNVIIASVGGVEITYDKDTNDEDGNGVAGFLSVYSDWVELMGPLDDASNPVPNYLRLFHGDDCATSPPQDGPALMDQLIRKNLLPNSRFSRRGLVLQRGTWQETPVALSD